MAIINHNKTKHMVIPVFVPHKGCPFDCIYCNQKSISGQSEEMTVQKMKEIVETHLATAGEDTSVEIGFYGGSFTGIEKDRQLELLSTAYEYVISGKVIGVRLSTRPDFINEEILQYLKEYGVGTIELGVQSLDEQVLKESCRGHGVNHVTVSSRLIKEFGFMLGIQTMIGLPGDTREKDLYTAHEVIRLKPHVVRIYPTLVIKGTYLEKMYNEGRYTPLSLEEAVDICAELLELYRQNGINVIRVGLQPTESIREGGDMVAGPYHPAFRQLVESRIMLKAIEGEIHAKGITGAGLIGAGDIKNASELVIYTDAGNVSNVVGNKKENVEYLKKKYGFARVSVKAGDTRGKRVYIGLLP